MNETYLRTARLLTQVAPSVFADDTFALKGGTAINLFYRDLPRLSVDLDLVFCDHTVPRVDALAHIDTGIRAMATRLRARGFTTRAPFTVDGETKLIVQRDDITVKIEVDTARICCVRCQPQPPRTRATVSRQSGHRARVHRKLCRHDDGTGGAR